MAELSEELRSQWHPSLNLSLTPELVNTSIKVWWLGKCGHEWESVIANRLNGGGCHICAGKKIVPGINDLASQNPVLAAQWHPTRNIPLLPTEITPKNSSKKIWWVCDLGHEWQARTLARADGSGCPFCAGSKILAGFNDLDTLNAELAAQWHPTKNHPITPKDISPNDRRKFWWICSNGHEWQHYVEDRNRRNPDCYYCSGFKVLQGFNDMATTHPALAEEWNFEKNFPLTPSMVSGTRGTNKWWICKEGHEWKASIHHRAKGSGCPVCSGNKVVQGFNDLAFRSPHLMKEWHPTKNTLDPAAVSWSSGLKAWWICSEGHEWEAQISNRNNGAGCNLCGFIRAGKLKSTPKAGINDLASQFPELAKDFSSKNHPVTPEMVHVGTGKRFWWECPKGHEWETPVHYRTGKDKTGCPTCAPNIYISRQEATIKSFLESLNLTVETSDRKILKGKEIDLYIPAKKVGIEFNGIYWHTEENGKDATYHYDKWRIAKSAGVELIQIWEDDFRDRKDAVLKMLARKLGVTSLLPAIHPACAEEAVVSDSAGLETVTLSVDVAGDFLRENAVQGFTAGSHYLGLRTNDGTLKSVLVLDSHLNSMSVISYTSVGLVEGGFRKLLEYATVAYSPASFTAVSDNCLPSDDLFLSHGFVPVEEIQPDYKYVVNNDRRDASEYDVARFKNDANLVYQAGLDVPALAKLNNMPKIWDAGGMKYLMRVV